MQSAKHPITEISTYHPYCSTKFTVAVAPWSISSTITLILCKAVALASLIIVTITK